MEVVRVLDIVEVETKQNKSRQQTANISDAVCAGISRYCSVVADMSGHDAHVVADDADNGDM